MNKDIEEALVKAESVKSEINQFIENQLPELTISSDATEVIASLFQAVIIMMDAAIDTIIVIEKVHETIRNQSNGN